MYNDTVLDHFSNPRNIGEIAGADGIGTVGNPIDGDRITIYVKIKDNRLTDVKAKTFGCAAAIAASSMVTVMAMGKTVTEALKLTNQAVAAALDGLPPKKIKCSNIAADALHNAIADHLAKLGSKGGSFSDS